MITEEVKKYIQQSVLCWLATCNSKGEPNVSPKELFTYRDEQTLLIAHLASPNSVKNIEENNQVCVSFVDVFVQKGFKLKGIATLVSKSDPSYKERIKPLIDLYSDIYPIQALIEIKVVSVSPIIAPNYYLNKDTTEASQIENAMKTYNVKPILKEES